MSLTAEQYPPSPVPSDDDLWECEKPFTAFGQWGEDRLDLRVFDQDTYWVDRAGEPHLLAEMPDEYRANVVAHLMGNVTSFYIATVRREAITVLTDALRGKVNVALLLDEADLPGAITDVAPETWLEGTPLMRRLRALCPTASRSYLTGAA